MNALRSTWLIARNDLRLEFRSGGRLLAMIAFVVLAGFLFGFALDRSRVAGRDVAAALIWLTILFAATAGAGVAADVGAGAGGGGSGATGAGAAGAARAVSTGGSARVARTAWRTARATAATSEAA